MGTQARWRSEWIDDVSKDEMWCWIKCSAEKKKKVRKDWKLFFLSPSLPPSLPPSTCALASISGCVLTPLWVAIVLKIATDLPHWIRFGLNLLQKRTTTMHQFALDSTKKATNLCTGKAFFELHWSFFYWSWGNILVFRNSCTTTVHVFVWCAC